MKSNLLSLAFLAAMTTAASATVSWQGEVMVLSSTGASCAAAELVAGQHYFSAYLPQNLSNNGTSSGLTFLTRRSASAIRFTSMGPNATYTGTRINGRGGFAAANGLIVSMTRTPAVVTATTPTLVINATITNFDGTTGCTATIRGAYVQRIN
jgi:hypothetical protein